MFQQLKNIDTAFRHIKVFSVVLILVCLLISGLVLFKSFQAIDVANNRVYILSNGKALEAFSGNRRDNIAVEAKDHIATFHQYFFSLDPDDKVIQTNITKALYLADESAKNQYDNLKEVSNPKSPFHTFYTNQKGDVIFYQDKRNLEGWFNSFYADIIMRTFNISTYITLNNILHYVANIVIGKVTTKVSIKNGLGRL